MFADSVLNKPHFLPCSPWADRAGWGRKRRTHWNKQRIFKFPRRLYYTILPRIIQFLVLLNRRIRFTFFTSYRIQFWQTCGGGGDRRTHLPGRPFPHCHDRCIQFPHMADQGPDSVVWQGPPPNPTPPYLTYPTLPWLCKRCH